MLVFLFRNQLARFSRLPPQGRACRQRYLSRDAANDRMAPPRHLGRHPFVEGGPEFDGGAHAPARRGAAGEHPPLSKPIDRQLPSLAGFNPPFSCHFRFIEFCHGASRVTNRYVWKQKYV